MLAIVIDKKLLGAIVADLMKYLKHYADNEHESSSFLRTIN